MSRQRDRSAEAAAIEDEAGEDLDGAEDAGDPSEGEVVPSEGEVVPSEGEVVGPREGVDPALVDDLLREVSDVTAVERDVAEAYVKHKGSLYRVLASRQDIGPHVAEDLLQDAFEEMLLQRRLEPLYNPAAMLVTVVGHHVCNFLRRKKRRPPCESEALAAELPTGRRSPEEDAMNAERVQEVERCLSEMEKGEARIFTLLEIEEMTHEEVAELFERQVGTIKSRHRKARASFEKLLSRHRLAVRGGKR